ncbi:MAG: hypothetical protein QXL77_03845 [Candidatus Bathyarchaeia archaeon]
MPVVSRDVPLIIFNMIVGEWIRLKIKREETARLMIISPWLSDVLFPIRNFGFNSNILDLGKHFKVSDFIRELYILSRSKDELIIVTLDYDSREVDYKNPKRFLNIEEQVNQARRNVTELRLLVLLSDYARIYLHPRNHAKIYITYYGAYIGSSNYTVGGLYNNDEAGVYIPRSDPMYQQALQLAMRIVSENGVREVKKSELEKRIQQYISEYPELESMVSYVEREF